VLARHSVLALVRVMTRAVRQEYVRIVTVPKLSEILGSFMDPQKELPVVVAKDQPELGCR
jgi:hypothetical protein